jgi:hypothetical protein
VTRSPSPRFGFAFGDHPDALRAFHFQRERAARHAQVWSEQHANALRELHQAYVKTGLRLTKGRTAWPLAVGAGKTESVVAFARAQYERAQRGSAPLTVLVCMERVAQLSDLYRAMIDAGIPEHFVAIHHRKSAEEISSEGLIAPVALADAPRFPVLLATHSLMLRGEANIAALNRYGEGERSLVVWDESLLKSQGHYLDLTTVAAACNTLGGFAHGFTEGPPNEDARDAHTFIQERLSVLREVFERQLRGAPIETVSPPELTPEDETRFLAGVTAVLTQQRGKVDLGGPAHLVLADFLDHLQRPLRVVPFVERGRRVGIVHYSTLIPASLQRLIVLDASHNIRFLTSEHDADLRVTGVDCTVKSFENVIVRHLKLGAGRDALDRSLPRKDSALMREIVEEVKGWPAEEAGILMTFKQSPREARRGRLSHAECIRAALKSAGLDADATLADGRPRFVFLTWGQHTGVSDYAYCTRALLVGILRRSRLDLSAAIVGQREDLTAPEAADAEQIKRVELSECFHNVVQALGRGACRSTFEGKASAMRAAVICSDEFPVEWWQAAMPGVSVEAWKAKHAKPARLSEDRHEAIRIALRRLPKDQGRVSSRTLRSLARLDGLSSDAYKRALKAVQADGWKYEGRSFVRVSPFD